MLKHLFRGFRQALRPSPPPQPETRAVALLPVPRPPAALIRRDDYMLTQEDNLKQDLEEAFAVLRARQHLSTAEKRRADGEFLVTMGVVEKFAYECLDFGPEQTHHIGVVALGKAFEQWLRATERYEVSKASFARAMTKVLEWQGGHRSTIEGNDLFVGCRLMADFTESLGAPKERFVGKARLGMGLAELFGRGGATG